MAEPNLNLNKKSDPVYGPYKSDDRDSIVLYYDLYDVGLWLKNRFIKKDQVHELLDDDWSGNTIYKGKPVFDTLVEVFGITDGILNFGMPYYNIQNDNFVDIYNEINDYDDEEDREDQVLDLEEKFNNDPNLIKVSFE